MRHQQYLSCAHAERRWAPGTMATMATGNVTGGVKKSSGVSVQTAVKEAWDSHVRNGEGDQGMGMPWIRCKLCVATDAWPRAAPPRVRHLFPTSYSLPSILDPSRPVRRASVSSSPVLSGPHLCTHSLTHELSLPLSRSLSPRTLAQLLSDSHTRTLGPSLLHTLAHAHSFPPRSRQRWTISLLGTARRPPRQASMYWLRCAQ